MRSHALRRAWPVLLVALALLAAVDGATIARRSGARPAPAPTMHAAGTRAATQDAAAAVRQLLELRADDLSRRDLASFTALLDPTQTAFVAAQRAQFVAMAQLPMTGISYSVDTASATTRPHVARFGAASTYAPTVTLSYELEGYDTTPVTAAEVDTFVERDGRWLFAADSDFGRPPAQMWQSGSLTVVRGRSSLVIAEPATAGSARAVADEVDRDVPTVTAVWGTDWPQQAVVLLPSTAAELGALVGESGDLSQIAAVESAEVGSDQGAGARIGVNPQPYASLSALGRQVVITHELTHVASRAYTTAQSPLWLVEGLADYVGFSQSGLPVTTIAAELQTRVRAGAVPTALPGDAAFRSDATDLAASYEEAWLACQLIAAKVGSSGLVRLYREVGTQSSAGDPVDAAMRDVLHEGLPQFTAEWVAAIRSQLGLA